MGKTSPARCQICQIAQKPQYKWAFELIPLRPLTSILPSLNITARQSRLSDGYGATVPAVWSQSFMLRKALYMSST